MADTLRQELRHSLKTRVTVIWDCGSTTASSTGILIQVGWDFIELAGAVPTFEDDEQCFEPPCNDPAALILETVIPIKAICAFVEDLPDRRKASLPWCCYAADPPVRAVGRAAKK